MEDIVQIVRQIGQQQAHNAYYRDCYSLFKLLQELTEHTFTELQRLYKFGTERARPILSINFSEIFRTQSATLLKEHAKPKRNARSSAQ
ncbi:hypothetical protein N7489_004829 [Penicillium chrysogenum]|uniref:uncharacterized protein n=1 Tax=Penicillium chrysogenum TaxID=5076 RepID=UPI0024DF1E1F|nr:uncharacterized protein N7489_004829 [Penicillium chrysogenum]KAJ5244733.1 hypothetical protein N7489_004829 [Penicillium chrysogenum]